MSKLIVRYVGLKDRETDHMAGTGMTWESGEEKAVPAAAWNVMKNHPDVWALVGEAPAEGLAAVKPQADPAVVAERDALLAEKAKLLERIADLEKLVGSQHKYVLAGEDGKPIVLDTMTVDQIKAWAKANGIEFDGRVRDHDKLAAEVFANATKA